MRPNLNFLLYSPSVYFCYYFSNVWVWISVFIFPPLFLPSFLTPPACVCMSVNEFIYSCVYWGCNLNKDLFLCVYWTAQKTSLGKIEGCLQTYLTQVFKGGLLLLIPNDSSNKYYDKHYCLKKHMYDFINNFWY